jgi:ribulose-phosphate 3-epimerase
MALIAPSLLSADFLHLEKDCRMLNESRADWFHLDVMDGHFVPNISFGPMIVDFIRKATPKYCDVHLMIEKPEKYLDVFRKSGADNISVHIEACPDLHGTLRRIRDLGSHAGIAINPGTPVQDLAPYLQEADLICMMSVHPGFGGQAFIETTYEKIRTLKNMIQAVGANIKIEVDGGVGLQNAASIIEAGADVLVAGNSVFRATDPKAAIAALKEI